MNEAIWHPPVQDVAQALDRAEVVELVGLTIERIVATRPSTTSNDITDITPPCGPGR
jgi:hypothetical protein